MDILFLLLPILWLLTEVLAGSFAELRLQLWFYSFLVSLAVEPKDLALALIVRFALTLPYRYDVVFPDVPLL